MAIPTVIELTSVPPITASWSERNGGQIFLLGGGVRGILSRDAALSIVDQLTRALNASKTQDVLARFLRDCVVDSSTGRVRCADLFQRFTDWDNPKSGNWSEKSFARALADRGYERKMSNGAWWIGIDLLPVPEELERVPDPDTRIGETLRSRTAALITAYPEKGRRLLALYGGLSIAGAEAEVVMIDGIAFTCDEARELVIALERDLHRTAGRPI